MEKINVILDTDIRNEIDDQFALVYLMKSLNDIKLDAITIAPFSSTKFTPTKNIKQGTNLSYNTACQILDLLNMAEYKSKIYKGATKYFNDSKSLNAASKKIIEIAKQNNKTTIIAIGALTNIALALHKQPKIANKLNIVWLGGHSLNHELNTEFNFRQDVEAVRIVFNSNANLTVIPCNGVARDLSTTIYELQHYLSYAGKVGEFLCDIFVKCKDVHREYSDNMVGESKILWDLSAVAYVLNKNWFECKTISTPNILDNMAYQFTSRKKLITFATKLDRQKIYKDFFVKLGYKKIKSKILTSIEALSILNNSRGLAPNDKWIEHSISVGNAAATIAKALNLDEDKARALGYIHDIGKRNGWGDKKSISHTVGGYNYIKSLNFDEEYANVCLTHSYLNNDIRCVAGGLPNKKRSTYSFVNYFISNHNYTEYEKIINLCDLMCMQKVTTLENRILNLITKYGTFENTIYHITEAKKLKIYFDDKLGYNIYKLFPTILEN